MGYVGEERYRARKQAAVLSVSRLLTRAALFSPDKSLAFEKCIFEFVEAVRPAVDQAAR
jgi:hypothetical protein